MGLTPIKTVIKVVQTPEKDGFDIYESEYEENEMNFGETRDVLLV